MYIYFDPFLRLTNTFIEVRLHIDQVPCCFIVLQLVYCLSFADEKRDRLDLVYISFSRLYRSPVQGH